MRFFYKHVSPCLNENRRPTYLPLPITAPSLRSAHAPVLEAKTNLCPGIELPSLKLMLTSLQRRRTIITLIDNNQLCHVTNL